MVCEYSILFPTPHRISQHQFEGLLYSGKTISRKNPSADVTWYFGLEIADFGTLSVVPPFEFLSILLASCDGCDAFPDIFAFSKI